MTTEAHSFKPEVVPIKAWNGRIFHYEASLFGFTATGGTKDEALQNLHGVMCRIKPPGGAMEVRIIHYKDWAAVVWYDVEQGWMYGVRHEDDPRDVYGHSNERLSRTDVTEKAKLELAIQSYVPNITDTSKVEYPEFTLTTEHSKEFHARAISANRYQYAIQVKKMSADDAHNYALKNPHRADLWIGDEK